ncbi:YcnI family protein [Nocardioides sp. HM23]|uniref:YcnI family copper-binding membrane protein n=1 Tax=Nocardioides bizhenqiangii TaxID=3095076 RepID=UPI002ACAA0E3|nr:YcnI family protein [Nocardioides sp. HM23]MDZ5622904.1 YcnI family protein [Nocardioides sp. HM23]
MHIRRIALPAAGAAGALALAVAPASAHVTITPDTTAAGAHAVLTFSAGHGCDGSPTTTVAIDMPDQVYAVTPTRNPYWTVEKVMADLDEPITDAHGNEITERVDQVVYEARTPLPDGQRDTFELSLQLPDAAGETLVFPVVQTCEEGENPWIETPAEGQDPEELEFPAPTVTITEAEAEGDSHGAGASDEEPAEPAASAEGTGGDEEDEDGNGLALAGLGTGVAGIVVGGIALARSRKA